MTNPMNSGQFGLELPPICVYIKQILDEYPEGGQILKELLQNADDAGARNVIFLHDETNHPTDHLWKDSLKKFNGPALYVYNDATFTDNDWCNIQKPQQSGKLDDPTKVGQFGLGFISVYHITDMPSILSGGYVGFIDPHEKHFVRLDPEEGVVDKRGKCWPISNELLQPEFKDQFRPFVNKLFGCTEDNFHKGAFPGTIFRFPLRNEESRISSVVYDGTRVSDLFHSFQKDAEISLLFLKNVESVSVFHKKHGLSVAKLLYKAGVSLQNRSQLRSDRFEFIKKIDEGGAISRSRIQIDSLSQSRGPTSTEYVIVNVVRRSTGLHVLMQDKDVNYLPWVGVAAQTASVTKGRTFCFLPLPEGEQTKLPVHVHGYLGLVKNRRSIKWPDHDSEHDKLARWNKQLIEDNLPMAYAEIIKEAIKRGLPSERVYQLWPKVDGLDGAWKKAVKTAVMKLEEEAILYSMDADGGSWRAPANVYIDTEHDPLIQKVLTHDKQRGYPVVHVPPHVVRALEWGGVTIRKVTPALIRRVVRNDPLHWLTRKERMSLLEYILEDEAFSDLEGIHLLPLQSGKFVAFARRSMPIYLQNYAIPTDIFPDMESRFSASDCPVQLTRATPSSQLRRMTTSDVPSILRESLPSDWVNGNGVVIWTSRSQPSSIDWLKKLWSWLRYSAVSLDELSNFALIPLRKTKSGALYLARLCENTLIYDKETRYGDSCTQLSNSVSSFLESLGAIVVKENPPEFVLEHTEMSTFIRSGNGKGIMYILGHLRNSVNLPSKVAKASADLKHDLASILSPEIHSFPSLWLQLVRQLPVFKATNGRYVKSTDCEYAVPSRLYGIPIRPKQLRTPFFVLDDASSVLCKFLGIQTISKYNLVKSHVFPQVDGHLVYSKVECDKLMAWALENPEFDDDVREVKFLLTSRREYSSPCELFVPDSWILNKLFQNCPVFPTGTYATGRFLEHLKRIGLKSESEVTAKELLEVAREIANAGDQSRSKVFLKYISRYSKKLYEGRGKQLGSFLSDIAWVSCECKPPSSYPTAVPWYGMSNKLYKPNRVQLLNAAPLVGSVAPLLDLKKNIDAFSKFFRWNINLTLTCSVIDVATHLVNLSKCPRASRDMGPMVDRIYTYMADKRADTQHLQTFRELLQDESWVWHGNGFSTPYKVAFHSIIQLGNLKSSLFVIPPELQDEEHEQVITLLKELGVKNSFAVEDFLNVLTDLKRIYDDMPLGRTDMETVLDIIKALTTSEDMDNIRAQILVPDDLGVLRQCEELVYNGDIESEEDGDSNLESFEGFKYTYDSITYHQARLLGIRTRHEIRLDQWSFDDGFERPFGQHEKLTTRLRGILSEYSHNPEVLKELLQNSDDAGASEIHVVYDPRKHDGAKISGESWRPMHSLPALCVYNNKPFTEDDIKGIQNVGVGGKISDTTTTGRFGIGFNAVYLLSDCPTFLTQNMKKLCIFDPHVKYIPRATIAKPGKLYDIDDRRGNRSFLETFADMTRGYLKEFKQFDLQNGTMFRFPLRPHDMKSDISDKCYDNDQVKELLDDFEKVSEEALLFLNNIAKISISEIDQRTGKLNLRYCVSVDISAQDSAKRRDLSTHLRDHKHLPMRDIPDMNRVYTINMTDSKKKNEVWMISQSIGLNQSIAIPEEDCEAGEFMTKSYLPRGGVAALLHASRPRYGVSGKAFCFLPLEIHTNLPVHVNGTFRLDHSRQNLKKGDKDPIHRWNKLLAMYVIGPAYAHLIAEARVIVHHKSLHLNEVNQTICCKKYDKLFPNLEMFSNLRGIWRLVGISVLKYIGVNDLKVLPVVKNYDGKTKQFTVTWFGPTSCSSDPETGAFFDDLSVLDASLSLDEKRLSSFFRTFLREIGFNLISCSVNIGKSFKAEEVGVKAEFISPESCREYVKNTLVHGLPCRIADTPFKTSDVLQIVLPYCLTGLSNVADLRGLPFRLDGDGMLGVFCSRDPKYLSFDHSLLPSLQGRFLDAYVVSLLREWVGCIKEAQENEGVTTLDIYHSGILKEFTIYELAQYMHTNYPPNWRNRPHHLQWKRGKGSLPQASWLQSLWNYISLSHTQDKPCDLQVLADWPIIPTTSGYLVSLRLSKSVLFPDKFISSGKSLILEVLQKIGCPLVDEEHILGQYYVSLSKRRTIREILRNYLAGPGSRSEILKVITHMVQQERRPIVPGILNEDECDTLLEYLQEGDEKLTTDKIQTIKQLPVFCLVKKGSRKSIEKYTYSYTIDGDIGTSVMATLDLVKKNVSVTFLKHNNHLEKLYEMIGIEPITLPRIYITFILPEMEQLGLGDRLRHILFIRDVVIPMCSKDEKEHMYKELSQVPFIEDLNGEVKSANRFFDPTNDIFSIAQDQIHLLPAMFRGPMWHQFLIDIGLKHTVTKELIIMFARSVEEKAESVVESEAINHLKNLSERLIDELQRNEDLLDGETLSDISKIEFVPTVKIEALYPQNGIKTAVDTSDFICFRGAIPEEHATLTWTVKPLIASTAVPCEIHELNSKEYPWSKIGEINIHRNLSITTVPNLKIVLQHTKILCTQIKEQEQNTLRQNDELDETARMKLIETIPEILEYLKNKLDGNNETLIKEGLQQVPICIVGDNEDKLVRANQLVFDMSEVDKATEYQLRPYLYRAPRHLGGFDKLLSVLGTEKEPTFQQLVIVLDEIHNRCQGEPMDVGERRSAYAAVRSMLLLLLKRRDSDGGNDKVVDDEVELYLPTAESKLRPSTSLYYTDRDDIELPGKEQNSDLVAPLRVIFDGYYIPTGEFQLTNYSELIDLLPNHLRPMKIATQEKPLDTNVPCNGGEQCSILQQMKELVQSEDLQIILLRIIYHQTGKDPSELKQQKIADLRKFDGFVCVQELRTAYFNSQGECLGNRPQSRDILLTSSGIDSRFFVIHIGHTDISEDTESGLIFFLPLAQSIDHICTLGLNPHHVCILKDVLVASPLQRNRVLEAHKVPEYQHLITECPGSIIPEDVCRLLEHDISYRFQLGEMAGYNMSGHDDNVDDVQFIYVKILDILAHDMNEESESIHYKIDIGGSQSIVISVDKLFHLSRSAGDLARYSDNADAVLAMSSGFSSSSAGRSCGHWSVPVPLSYSSYMSRSEPVKAKLWQRQAREDFETVQAIFRNRTVASLAWQAFILHQAAEKALKAAIFQLHGNQSMTHNLSALVSDVNAHSSGERYASRLRGPVGQLLQLGCDPIRPRYPEYTQKTTGEVYKALPFQTAEALEVCKSILEIVDEILGSSNADSDSELD